ncbi:hypothetical protein [Cecembia rubra]|uniref:Uncharacterized protein n=1 Tax=Cecembia rubra TaxID=1485585 RepID=A0A2P8E327_9BACT|nr:hypothetical protein [Cecembia rubra]PSL03879.1 hypothetical protein CLV48_106119 [Cecembia rubra]
MDIYRLSRSFWDFAFENPDKIKPNHCALFFFAIEHCNRLGWKEKFGLPTTMVMEAIGIKSYNTYIKTFNELVEIGLFVLHQKSKNQYSSNIIALSKFDKANDKALDKALIKHGTKQRESTEQSIDSIDIQYTNLKINKSTIDDSPDLIEKKIDEERVIKGTKQIAEFFSISELRQPKHYMTIGNFVRHHALKGNLDHLAEQFTAYQMIKSKDPKFKHKWYNWIGSPEKSYEDGQWNIVDWVEEMERQKEPVDKKTINAMKRTYELLNEK